MLLDKTRFRALVVTSDHNNRVIPIAFNNLVLTKSWGGRFHGMFLIYLVNYMEVARTYYLLSIYKMIY